VLAAVGRPRRTLPTALPPGLRLPDGFADARVCLPGAIAVRAPASGSEGLAKDFAAFCAAFRADDPLCAFPLVVLVDDSEFCGRSLENFLWVTFSRSNPATDVGGIEAPQCTSTGAAGIAGDRCPSQTSPRTPLGGGSASHRPRRRHVRHRRPARGPRVKETARWGDPPRRCECRTGLEGAGTGVALRCHSGLR